MPYDFWVSRDEGLHKKLVEVRNLSECPENKLMTQHNKALAKDLHHISLALEQYLMKLPPPDTLLTFSDKTIVDNIQQIFLGMSKLFDIRIKELTRICLKQVEQQEESLDKKLLLDLHKKPLKGRCTRKEKFPEITMIDLEERPSLLHADVSRSALFRQVEDEEFFALDYGFGEMSIDVDMMREITMAQPLLELPSLGRAERPSEILMETDERFSLRLSLGMPMEHEERLSILPPSEVPAIYEERIIPPAEEHVDQMKELRTNFESLSESVPEPRRRQQRLLRKNIHKREPCWTEERMQRKLMDLELETGEDLIDFYTMTGELEWDYNFVPLEEGWLDYFQHSVELEPDNGIHLLCPKINMASISDLTSKMKIPQNPDELPLLPWPEIVCPAHLGSPPEVETQSRRELRMVLGFEGPREAPQNQPGEPPISETAPRTSVMDEPEVMLVAPSTEFELRRESLDSMPPLPKRSRMSVPEDRPATITPLGEALSSAPQNSQQLLARIIEIRSAKNDKVVFTELCPKGSEKNFAVQVFSDLLQLWSENSITVHQTSSDPDHIFIDI